MVEEGGEKPPSFVRGDSAMLGLHATPAGRSEMARFGVLGTGSAGRTLASRLVSLGHERDDGLAAGRQREGGRVGQGRWSARERGHLRGGGGLRGDGRQRDRGGGVARR